MPWRKLPKKDAIGRDSRRVGANNLLSGGFRMGQPLRWQHRRTRALREWDTRGTETSKYPEEKKSIEIPSVAVSEIGTA